jgi:hypothetical protein
MVEGKAYTLTLDVFTGGFVSTKKMTLYTNMKPRDGVCLLNQTEGTASSGQKG